MRSATTRSWSGSVDYAPDRVADAVGLPAEVIERFAREYATTQPSLLRPLIGIEHHRNGAMLFRTIACLPVLTGAWRHRGGGLARSTHALHFAVLDMDHVEMPELDEAGRPRAQHARSRQGPLRSGARAADPLADRLRREPDGVDAQPGAHSRRPAARRPLHDRSRPVRHRHRALADYVLPATSQIEHLDLSPAWGHLYLALNRPAIAPRGESI